MFNLLFKETDQISCSTASIHPKTRAQIWVKRTWLLNSYFSKSSSGQKSSRFSRGVVWVEGRREAPVSPKGALQKQGHWSNLAAFDCLSTTRDPEAAPWTPSTPTSLTIRPIWSPSEGIEKCEGQSFKKDIQQPFPYDTCFLSKEPGFTLCGYIQVPLYHDLMILLSIMDVIFRPFRFDNTFSDLGSGSTNSTQSLWFRPWLCQVLASGMRHGFQGRL